MTIFVGLLRDSPFFAAAKSKMGAGSGSEEGISEVAELSLEEDSDVDSLVCSEDWLSDVAELSLETDSSVETLVASEEDVRYDGWLWLEEGSSEVTLQSQGGHSCEVVLLLQGTHSSEVEDDTAQEQGSVLSEASLDLDSSPQEARSNPEERINKVNKLDFMVMSPFL